jgi:hypothetical protein
MRLAWLCCALVTALCVGTARADTPLTLFKTFTGYVNFVGTEKTMRGGATDCSMVSSTKDLVLHLTKIPSGSTVLSAQLYWAGSNIQANADYTVTFAGTSVSAPTTRRYFSNTIGSGYDYFAGAADVTSMVKGNADYHVHNLTVSNTTPWCKGQGVLGGFALLVVYSNPATEPFRVLNVYEGLQYLRNSSVTLNASNFKVPDVPSDGHIGYLAWSGDAGIKPGESVVLNGTSLADVQNPSGNQFNSVSTAADPPDATSFGIDFDDYTISACTCQAGQTNATLTLQTAADMILYQMAVLSTPSVPTADLKLTITRGSDLAVGGNTNYVLNASSAGPDTDPGPITVTDTLPAGLSFVGASGSGWSCSVSGQTVTCSTPGPVASGAVLAPVTITVRTSAAGTYTNTAAVSGGAYDYAPDNNSASGTASTGGDYVFTDAACAAGKAFGAADQPCHKYAGPATAGAAAGLYVTLVDASGTPVILNATSSAAVSVRLALTCLKPATEQGVQASYAGVALPLCSANGVVPAPANAGWSQPVTLTFPANSATAQLAGGFVYEDVGQVVLSLVDANSKVNSSAFVVRPAKLVFSAITRSSDGVANPGATDGTGLGFARAGEAFTLSVAALSASGKKAPGFGAEGAKVALQQDRLPTVQGSFDTLTGGVFSGAAFSWDEAGIVVLTPRLAGDDYLGTGTVLGDAASVGRFYPDHFETAVSSAFACLTRMACPSGSTAAGDSLDVSGAVYSGQPFQVVVRPIGVAGNTLSNYSGGYARQIVLAAFDSPAGTQVNPGSGVLGANTIASVAAGQQPSANPTYQLPGQYLGSAPRALGWSAPTAIYLRASSNELIAAAGNTSQWVTVSSKRASGTVEGGVSVVQGRLNLSNAFGSELLKLALPVAAQYWTGANWDNNSADNASAVGVVASFSRCLRHLDNGSAPPNNCKSVLALSSSAPLPLVAGGGTLWLQAPGSGNDGSAQVQLASPGAPWLPSTIARAAFGLYKSSALFGRELY